MKALIFAAGLGERMRPLTNTTPKPLLRSGRQAADRVAPGEARGARRARGRRQHELAGGRSSREVLGDGSRWGLRLHYSLRRSERRSKPAAACSTRCRSARRRAVPRGERRRVDGFRFRALAARPAMATRTWCSSTIRRSIRAAISTLQSTARSGRTAHEKLTYAGIGVYRAVVVRRLARDHRRCDRRRTKRRRASSCRRCCVAAMARGAVTGRASHGALDGCGNAATACGAGRVTRRVSASPALLIAQHIAQERHRDLPLRRQRRAIQHIEQSRQRRKVPPAPPQQPIDRRFIEHQPAPLRTRTQHVAARLVVQRRQHRRARIATSANAGPATLNAN